MAPPQGPNTCLDLVNRLLLCLRIKGLSSSKKKEGQIQHTCEGLISLIVSVKQKYFEVPLSIEEGYVILELHDWLLLPLSGREKHVVA